MIKEEFKICKEVRLYCDDCGCEMVHSGGYLASNPPQFPHQCSECNRVENSRGKPYPMIEYEDISCLDEHIIEVVCKAIEANKLCIRDIIKRVTENYKNE